MILAQTFRISVAEWLVLVVWGSHTGLRLFFGWFIQPFNSFPEHVWFKVSLALLPSATVQKMALKIRNTDIQVQHKL